MGVAAILVIAVPLMAIMLWWLFTGRTIVTCYDCGAALTAPRNLGAHEQSQILRFYRDMEKREPDTAHMLVCRQCRRVWDETVTGSDHREAPLRCRCKACGQPGVGFMHDVLLTRAPALRAKYPALIAAYECLRCRRTRGSASDCVSCDTQKKLLACASCLALYEFRSPAWSTLRFLTPLTAGAAEAAQKTQTG